jgi:hypothetical protein
MIHEHRVLTAHQITALAVVPLRADAAAGVVHVGRAGPLPAIHLRRHRADALRARAAGAAVLAAEDGLNVKELGYRHDRAFGVAHSLRLAHTVGVNDWFTALVNRARHSHPGEHATLSAWWVEARCARHFGDLIKPDAYGRWSAHGQQIEFFLEYDFGTEVLAKLTGKLTGYAALAEATGITTPLLIWLPTSRREATARRLLHRAWRDLDDPNSAPVATAAAELLNAEAAHPSPADEVFCRWKRSAGSPSAALCTSCSAAGRTSRPRSPTTRRRPGRTHPSCWRSARSKPTTAAPRCRASRAVTTHSAPVLSPGARGCQARQVWARHATFL